MGNEIIKIFFISLVKRILLEFPILSKRRRKKRNYREVEKARKKLFTRFYGVCIPVTRPSPEDK